jgi:hypothetical protein
MGLRPIALSLLLAACGGNKNPPMHPDTPVSENDAGDTDTGALATSDGGGASAAPDAGAAPPAPQASGGGSGMPAGVSEAPDECTPIGVEFEKKARPKLKECYREAKKNDKNLQGTVKITVDVDTLGKMKDPKIVENTLGDAVGKCMLKVVKSTPMPESKKCPGKSITIPVTFPTPH